MSLRYLLQNAFISDCSSDTGNSCGDHDDDDDIFMDCHASSTEFCMPLPPPSQQSTLDEDHQSSDTFFSARSVPSHLTFQADTSPSYTQPDTSTTPGHIHDDVLCNISYQCETGSLQTDTFATCNPTSRNQPIVSAAAAATTADEEPAYVSDDSSVDASIPNPVDDTISEGGTTSMSFFSALQQQKQHPCQTTLPYTTTADSESVYVSFIEDNNETPREREAWTSAFMSCATTDSFAIGDHVEIVAGVDRGATGHIHLSSRERITLKIDGSDLLKLVSPQEVRPVVVDDESHELVPESSGDESDDDSSTSYFSLSSEETLCQLSSETTMLSPRDLDRGDRSQARSPNMAVNSVTITAGIHEGKTATFVKVTNKRVAVMVHSIGEVRHLNPKNVSSHDSGTMAAINSILSSSIAGTVKPPNLAPVHADGERMDLGLPRRTVSIVGGTHVGKTGTFVKATQKRVAVDVQGLGIRYLDPKHVSMAQLDWQDNGSAIDSFVPGPISRVDGKVIAMGGKSARKIAVKGAKSTKSSRSSAVSKSPAYTSSAAASWRIPGGDDPYLHSNFGLREDYVRLAAPGEIPDKEKTLAHAVFGSRVRMFKITVIASSESIPRDFVERDGSHYQLLTAKLERSKAGPQGVHIVRKHVQAIYLLVSGKDIPTIDLDLEFRKIAGFGRLAPEKVAARLELFQSTGKVLNGRPLIFGDLTSRDLEVVPEIGHEGCGYIPRAYLERFLGRFAVGKRTFAIQVRIVAPKLGVFKGVLKEKPGISAIQLPPSMRKVGPSEEIVKDKAILVITGTFPSTPSIALSKLFEGQPRNSFTPKKLGDMIRFLFQAHGVPSDLALRYIDKSCKKGGKGLKHASLVGLSDCTESIPPGSIFLPGIGNALDTGDEFKVFVTRYPCTEKGDGLMLPVVTKKPLEMSYENWEFLNRLHLGCVVFGNPTPGDKPLPTKIADGDLDGDLYFVCWEDEILNFMDPAEPMVESDHFPLDVEATEPRAWNEDWLLDGQNYMRDITRLTGLDKLISKLYKLWKDRVSKGDFSLDAVHFGRAVKASIDIGKHGGRVYLPGHLWSEVDDQLHAYLIHE